MGRMAVVRRYETAVSAGLLAQGVDRRVNYLIPNDPIDSLPWTALVKPTNENP